MHLQVVHRSCVPSIFQSTPIDRDASKTMLANLLNSSKQRDPVPTCFHLAYRLKSTFECYNLLIQLWCAAID